MVDKKISELPEVTSVGESDVVPVVVDDNGLITSKVQVGNLRAPPDNKTLALDEDGKLKIKDKESDRLQLEYSFVLQALDFKIITD